jgi:hypothetical protein
MKVKTRLTYYLKVNYLRIEINLNHPGTPSGPMKTKDLTILRLENNYRNNTNNNERAHESCRSPRVGQSRVAILGDSMLKQINGDKFNKE